jgi:hypothetical protein
MERIHRVLLALLAPVALASLIVAAAACDDDDDNAQPLAAIPSVTVTARDFSFEAPDLIAGGRVAIDFRNEGAEEHHAQFLRLNDGVRPEQLLAALQQDESAILQMSTLASGPSVTGPGLSSEVILDLTEGNYLMLCVIPSADGVPHVAKGMLKPFQVSGEAPPAQPLRLDGEIVLADFSIQMPPLQAGERTLRVTNNGPQPHEVALMKLTDGAAIAEAEAFLRGEGPPPPGLSIGGAQALGQGGRAWVRVELTPGAYAAICFIPDPATGKPHFLLGMATVFSVE